MSGLALDHEVDVAVTVRDGDNPLLRYVYAPDTVQLESPKPYVHPVRTRAGHVVSLYRPHDHVWHKGIAWSLPNVGDQNFWGGPTYVHGRSYVQLDNNGTQRHRGVVGLGRDGGGAEFTHELDWITQAGAPYFTERRSLRAELVSDAAWVLVFETAMTNASGASVSIGSPTTKGRENAGYGGLFWRGPRSFTGGRLVGAEGSGGDELRGRRAEWLAFTGRHDESDAASTILMVDDEANPHHPPQWFARSEQFACLNPAPFFSEELEIGDGETVAFRYAVGVADGAAEDVADDLLTAARDVLARTSGRSVVEAAG
ncbi:PmoA family protein [Naasia sp. SYSU D00948]|uniref:DUF6807 domain-containing protein n=1 Tax=Naasia sp. SYSU D00948 TaxID=2817379 RepID=UPI001B309DF7|nr:PmoA family protein [Naasia sp. SYSU D00948]